MMQSDKSKGFSINAKTCTLRYNSQENGGTVLGLGVNYIIPIYQRPYSWTEEQIRKFLSDIFLSYWDNEGNIIEEPMFIGTIQLSDKNDENEQEIIDGQQRLTTFLILFRTLKQKFSTCEELKNMNFDWLSTRVSNGKQQSYLKEIIQSDLIFNNETLNPYLRNASLINEVIEEQIKDEQGKPLVFEIDRFIKHLLSNIYFVVIETRAGLSKTLQIFNAINTTGLDLNGGDIFKIKMYEYLRDIQGKDESAFEEINKLYQKIDENNSKLDYKATDITGILSIYQYILIAKYNLPVTLYSYGTDTFFERLFDTLFNNKQWEYFANNLKSLKLSLEDIERIIDVRYEREDNRYLTAEDACAMNFIWWSRYSRYWILTFVFLYKFKDEEDYWNNMLVFMRQLNKLYTIYSIRFLKAINEIRTFTYLIVKEILDKPFDDLMNTINQKIGNLETHKGWADLENTLTGDITYNTMIKNIICRLSAMLNEDYKTTDRNKIEIIKKSLFGSPVDIEHIQAYHDSKGERREDIWNEWQDNINSIGNLMVLEQSINRSIGNSPYEVKIERYPSSIFSIVKQQPINYPTWNLAKCKERKNEEIKKILNYIFS